jgi:hypothetical protein
VDLINEQHDVAAGLDLLQDLLQPFLEITAITTAGNQRAEIEGVNLLIAQRLWNITTDDCLGKAFDNGRLTDTRLANQHGIVFGAP